VPGRAVLDDSFLLIKKTNIQGTWGNRTTEIRDPATESFIIGIITFCFALVERGYVYLSILNNIDLMNNIVRKQRRAKRKGTCPSQLAIYCYLE